MIKVVSTQQNKATFIATKFGDKEIAIYVLILAGLNIEIRQIKAPKTYGVMPQVIMVKHDYPVCCDLSIAK